DGDRHPKRRKTRKGTRSCWACKKRKEKCIFDSSSNLCQGCQRRGTSCIGQEFPDDVEVTPSGPTHGGIPSPASIQSESTACPQSFLTYSNDPVSFTTLTPSAANQHPANRSSICERHTRLSKKLHDTLPSPQDCEILCKASHRNYYMLDEILSFRARRRSQHPEKLLSPESILTRPQPHHHPVLIARYMLQLSLILQQFSPNDGQYEGLSESPQEMLDRLSDTAISLVCVHDRLLGSIEGVHCVVLESMYYANCGSLRLSWTSGRRAMSLAQMMGFHLPESRLQYQVLERHSDAHPYYLWWRMLYFDRSMSLLLGLPSGSSARNTTADATYIGDTPLERLDRIHCNIGARLLECKESETKFHDLSLVQELDKELRVAARSVPNKWWLIPNLADTTRDNEAIFWELKRLMTQMLHYKLLSHLHLPFMLRSPSDQNHETSRIACVNASREILSRFIVLRNFKRISMCCKIQEFIALMAAVTLLLAHLDNHRRCSETASGGTGFANVLAHQYSSDRAMMEKVQESMEEIYRLSRDTFCAESADLLHQLLVIDAETAGSYMEEDIGTHMTGNPRSQGRETENTVSIHIAYFGVIRIARDGSITKDVPTPSQHPSTRRNNPTQPTNTANIVPSISTSQATISSRSNQTSDILTDIQRADEWPVRSAVVPRQSSQWADIHPNTSNDESFAHPTSTQSEKATFDPFMPGLTAGADDWTFQGVDMAFFDSLM
ncbi:hypothetical protein DM02DRAFT_471419, partial [Periconia macrospinosa]